MGMTILIMFSCHALSSLPLSPFASFTLVPSPLFSLLPSLSDLRAAVFLKKQTKLEKERIGGDIKNTVNHLNSP